jgi:hypothetical protein
MTHDCPRCAEPRTIHLRVQAHPALLAKAGVREELHKQLDAILEDAGVAKGAGPEIAALDELADQLARGFDVRLRGLADFAKREAAR